MQSKKPNELIFPFPTKKLPSVLDTFNYPHSPMNNLNSTISGGFQNGGALNSVAGPYYIQNPNPLFFNSMSSPNSLQYGGPPLFNPPPVYPNHILMPNPNGLYSHDSLNKRVNFNSHQNNFSMKNLVDNFQAAMQSRKVILTRTIWEENPILEGWYSGEIKHPNDGDYISFEILNKTFEAALRAQNFFVIKKLWEINPLLKSWHKGEKINTAKTGEAKNEECISFPTLKNHFESTLRGHNTLLTRSLWEINPLLKSWYSGEIVNGQRISLAELDYVWGSQINCTFIRKTWETLRASFQEGAPYFIGTWCQ